jgi:hypothetical protein
MYENQCLRILSASSTRAGRTLDSAAVEFYFCDRICKLDEGNPTFGCSTHLTLDT